MKKPLATLSSDVVKHVDPNKRVQVYRNLHNECFSVKQGGRVICHAHNVTLRDVKFLVAPAGQRKVREEKKKNVHATLTGYPTSVHGFIKNRDEKRSAYYQPYLTDTWVDYHEREKVIEKSNHAWLTFMKTDMAVVYYK